MRIKLDLSCMMLSTSFSQIVYVSNRGSIYVSSSGLTLNMNPYLDWVKVKTDIRLTV